MLCSAFLFRSSSLDDAKTLAVFASCGLAPAALAAFDFRLVIIAHPPLPSSAPSPASGLGALASALGGSGDPATSTLRFPTSPPPFWITIQSLSSMSVFMSFLLLPAIPRTIPTMIL